MQNSLVLTGKGIATAFGAITLFAGGAMADGNNYDANAAGNASSPGINNANCNSALHREYCLAEAAYAEAEASSAQPQPVPEPGTGLLLGTTLLMLFAAKKFSRGSGTRSGDASSQTR